MEVENAEVVVENAAEEVENKAEEVKNAIEPEIKPTTVPVYEAKNKILCDLCGKCYVKASISKHRKLCLAKNAKSETEVPDNSVKKEVSIAVVPVEVTEPPPPPPPPKLERQTNKAYSREEALSDPADEYEQVVNKPVPPKPLTRVDKLRMLARNGLP